MKPTFKLFALLMLIACTSITLSCKKDNDNNTVKSKKELLTTGIWKRTALVSSPAYDWNANGVFDTNVLNIMFPCEKDNFETYKVNGEVVTDEGPSKCDPTEPQTWTATWDFANNETIIVIDGVDEYTILELTATTLKLTSTFVEGGVTYTHVETYGH